MEKKHTVTQERKLDVSLIRERGLLKHRRGAYIIHNTREEHIFIREAQCHMVEFF
jgi:hypothetical protein